MSTHARLRFLLSVLGGMFVGSKAPYLFGEQWAIGWAILFAYCAVQSIVLNILFPEPPVKS